MATIINNPGTGDDSGSSIVSIVLVLIIVLVATGLFFVYGLPNMRSSGATTPSAIDVNVTVPTPAQTPAPAP